MNPERGRVMACVATEHVDQVWDDYNGPAAFATGPLHPLRFSGHEGGALLIMQPHQELPDQTPARVPTSVYRYYDDRGLLLYVGITSRGTTRNGEHNRDKEWWKFVGSQNVEHYATRPEAAAREKALIRQYRPPFNTHHNPDHEDTRAVYLASRSAYTGAAAAFPRWIECSLIERVDGRPVLRSITPLGRPFVVEPPARLTARMVGSAYRFSRVTKVREKATFLIVELLRDNPDLTGARVQVKWTNKAGQWRMQILAVAVDCRGAA